MFSAYRYSFGSSLQDSNLCNEVGDQDNVVVTTPPSLLGCDMYTIETPPQCHLPPLLACSFTPRQRTRRDQPSSSSSGSCCPVSIYSHLPCPIAIALIIHQLFRKFLHVEATTSPDAATHLSVAHSINSYAMIRGTDQKRIWFRVRRKVLKTAALATPARGFCRLGARP